MDGSVRNVILATFALSLFSSAISSLVATYYGERDSQTLARFRRQTQDHSCKGDNDKFQCATTADCIDVVLECDGKEDCPDGSDEKESRCSTFPCYEYLFRCDYGACIESDQRCDGVKHCNDNSDEINCSGTNSVNTNGSNKCTTPKQPENGQWQYLHDGRKRAPNVQVEVSTVISFLCDVGYKLSSTNDASQFIVCLPEGQWSVTVIPTCQKLCPAIYNSPLVTISCKTDGSTVPCDKATDNTILAYKCAPYYEPAPGRPQGSSCYDGTWDYYPQCIPVCGKKRVTATPLIVNGVEVERGNYPWAAALYSSKYSDPYYTLICGGTIISTNVVLTAAQCLTEKQNGKAYPSKYYRVAAGKYYNLYEDARDRDTAQYSEVAEILINREYRGEVQNYRGDIALLKLKTTLALSKVVQPVCYDNLPSLEPNSTGVMTGWGYTTQTGEPSETLKELEMPYNDDDQCYSEFDPDFAQRYFTPDKFCAGFFNSNTSVCKGDSGGGLVFRNPSYNNRFFVHGIGSVAHYYVQNEQVYCDIQRSALFTRVLNYKSWIQLTVRRWTPNRAETR